MDKLRQQPEIRENDSSLITERLQKMNRLSSSYESYNLSKDVVPIYVRRENLASEEELARAEIQGKITPDLLHEYRSGLACTIGEIWHFIEDSPKLRELLEPLLVENIEKGTHPIDAVAEYCVSTLALASDLWEKSKEEKIDETHKRMTRLAKLFARSQSFSIIDDQNPGDTMKRGGQVGISIIRSVEWTLDELWKKQFGATIPLDEADKSLSESTLMPLLASWQRMKVEIVNMFEASIFGGVQKLPSGKAFPNIDTGTFELLRDKNGAWVPIPKEDVLWKLERIGPPRANSEYNRRTGCPAASAYTPLEFLATTLSPSITKGMDSVLTRVIKWNIGLVRQHWLPTLKNA